MTKATFAQVDFTGGVFDPLVDARIDAARYATGLKQCVGYYPVPQGPLIRTPGTRSVTFTKDNGKAILVPFQYSVTDTYQIEFGDKYARFYRNNGLVLNTPLTISGVTTGATTTITSTAHGLTNGTRIWLSGLVSTGSDIPLEALNDAEYQVANATTDTFELQRPGGIAIDTSGHNTWSSGGTVASIYEIVTPYDEDDIYDLKWAQSFDVLFITHKDYPPAKLSRSGHTNWSLATMVLLNGPFMPVNTTDTSLTPSGVGPGSVTVTASATTGINGGAGFSSNDVGRDIRFMDTNLNWVVGTISSVTNTTEITVVLSGELADVAPIKAWRLDLWNAYNGYPAAVTLFEDRLVMGGCPAFPQRVDGSRTGVYDDFLPSDPDGTVADDHAISFTFGSEDVNVIRWLTTQRGAIFAGTPANEWVIRSAYEDEPLTPTSVFVLENSKWGSAPTAPLVVSQSVLFINRTKRELRELVYNRRDDQSPVTDLSELSGAKMVSGLEQLVYQQYPHQLVWARRADGMLMSLSYRRLPDVFFAGWQEQPLGGGEANGEYADGSVRYGAVEWLSSNPSTTEPRDEVWLIVNRKINGQTVRSVEYLEKPTTTEVSMAAACHLDMSREYISGTDIVMLPSLGRYEGSTLQTWVNGQAGPDIVVEDGYATLPVELGARHVQVGFVKPAEGELLRPEAGGQNGPALGKIRRMTRASLNLYRTMGLEVSTDITVHWDVVKSTENEFSGVIKQDVPSDDNFEGRLKWRQTTAAPATIRSITGFIDTRDDG